MLTFASDVLLPSTLQIINISLHTGVFPDVLKEAIVFPIHKGGPSDDPSNYRPISILPIVFKVIEKHITKFFYKRLISPLVCIILLKQIAEHCGWIEGDKSSISTKRLPQGSGFVPYILNDLPLHLQTYIESYADDTSTHTARKSGEVVDQLTKPTFRSRYAQTPFGSAPVPILLS